MTLGSFEVSRRTLIRGAGMAAAAVGTGALLAACAPTGSTGGSSDPKVLNLMIPSWVDAKFIKDVMQGSAAGLIGAKINLITTDDGTYPAQAAAAQKAGKAPDLLMWTAQGIPAFQSAGVKLSPLDKYAVDEDKTAFYEQDYLANSIDDKLYALGFRSDCRAVGYHGDFAPTAAPDKWTFDEFGEWAQTLKHSGRDAFGFEAKPGDGRASSNFLPLIWSTGSPFVKKGSSGKWEIGFEAEQMTQVMKFYYDSVNTWGITPKEVANWGYQETDTKFAQGTLAAYSTGPFVVANSKAYPDTLANLKLVGLPYATKPANFWEELSFMVHEDSTKKDLAWQFITAMRSEKVQAEIVARTADAWLGVRKAANASVTDPVLKAFVPLLDVSVVPEPINVGPIMNEAVLPAIGAVSLKGTSPEQAAEQLMTAMKDSLTRL